MTDDATDETKAGTDNDPPGGHDPAALEDAKKKMHVSEGSPETSADSDPPGGHDPAALEDAANKTHVKH